MNVKDNSKPKFFCPHCKQEINPSEILRTRNKKTLNCVVCGKEFNGSKKSKFCSNACRQRDKYARMKQKKQLAST